MKHLQRGRLQILPGQLLQSSVTFHGQKLFPTWRRNSSCSSSWPLLLILSLSPLSRAWHHPPWKYLCAQSLWGSNCSQTGTEAISEARTSSSPPQLPSAHKHQRSFHPGRFDSPQGRSFKSHMKVQFKPLCEKQSLCRKKAPGSC